MDKSLSPWIEMGFIIFNLVLGQLLLMLVLGFDVLIDSVSARVLHFSVFGWPD